MAPDDAGKIVTVTLPGRPAVAVDTRRGCLAWTPTEIRRHAREMAISCLRERKVLRDPWLGLQPTAETPEGAFLRAADPRWWRRNLERAIRIHQEEAARRLGLVGKGGRSYAGPCAAEWYDHRERATADFLSRYVVYDHVSGNSVPIAKVAKDAEARAAEIYATLKAVEALANRDGLGWAMLTITLPGPWHANPGNGTKSWNGKDARAAHQEIALGWKGFHDTLRNNGLRLTGVRVEEPMEDGTPHWHALILYRDSRDLTLTQQAIMKHWPAGLKVRSSRNTAAGKLRFDVRVYDTPADVAAGRYHRNRRRGAQCQLDVGNAQVSSMASYVIKYASKTVGYAMGGNKSPSHPSPSARAVQEHRQTYGIHALQFYGLPRGWKFAWNALRRIRPEDQPSPALQSLANLAQQPKGAGMVGLLDYLGSLAISRPQGAAFPRIEPEKLPRTNRYSEPSAKTIGIRLVDAAGRPVEVLGFNAGDREIMSAEAAQGIQTLPADSERLVVGNGYRVHFGQPGQISGPIWANSVLHEKNLMVQEGAPAP